MYAKLIPPVTASDPRVLGAGSSKFAWKTDTIRGAVINSFDWQRKQQQPEGMTWEAWNIQYNKYMETEYEFTKYVRTIFWDLIPWVEYIPSRRFYDKKFRFEKELCDKVEMNVQLFHEMFSMEDTVLSKGWVFLDMKPANIGLHKNTNRSLCLIDTDPCCFYKVPPQVLEHFRIASYMVILLISLIHRIPNHVLVEKMIEKGLTLDTIEKTYVYFKRIDMKPIEEYGNLFLKRERFKLTDLQSPTLYIDHYGAGQRLMTLLALAQQMPVRSLNLDQSNTDHSFDLNKSKSIHSLNLDHSKSVHSLDLDQSNSEHSLNLDQSNSYGKVSQNSSAYSMNSLLNHLEAVPSPVYYPRNPRKRLTKRRTTRVLARNIVRKPVNTIREQVLQRKRQNELEKARTNKRNPTRKTAKGIKI